MRVLSIVCLMALSGCVIPLDIGASSNSGGLLAPVGGTGPGVRQVNAIEDMSFGTILNSYRATVNAQPVTFDARLNTAAQDYADVLAANPGHFSSGDPHVAPDGTTTLQRIRATGYNPRGYAENLSGNQSNEQAALRAWINSASHDRNLKAAPLDEFGLGLAEASGGQTRWVLVLGSE